MTRTKQAGPIAGETESFLPRFFNRLTGKAYKDVGNKFRASYDPLREIVKNNLREQAAAGPNFTQEQYRRWSDAEKQLRSLKETGRYHQDLVNRAVRNTRIGTGVGAATLGGGIGLYQAAKESQYKLSKRMKFRGLDISIETDEGEVRHWTDSSTGDKGKTKMHVPYGYIRRTAGADGDHVDVFVGPYETADNVYVIHQRKAPDFKAYDEDKCMLGFNSAEEAKAAYKNHYSDDRFFGSMTTMSFEEFKKKALATYEAPGKIAMMTGVTQRVTKALRQFSKTSGATSVVSGAAPVVSSALGEKLMRYAPAALLAGGAGALAGTGIGYLHAHGPVRTADRGKDPTARGAVGGGLGAAAGTVGAMALARKLGLDPDTALRLGINLGMGGGAIGSSAGAISGSHERGDLDKWLINKGIKTGAATVQDTAHEVRDISRKLRGFARRNPEREGTELEHNLAAKTAASRALYERHLEKAANLLKHAWPWSTGGQGVSTISQNYHPDTVTRARDIEQGRAPSVARPQLPPQGPPAAAAPAAAPATAAAAAPAPRLTNERAMHTNWDRPGV